ncbi:hypothetical protein [Ancylobacter defluvii]|uniref:Uncharacterized protein n=1 Tax=Ancylobacter defluvii TaxID=1282440 RepID=A0A9W6NCF1_9HYPH|nr:hypothetical protein [Ancylobacter defluvii]MBS7586457.1 hypothetical protein [Ancylobacter defluvii]GLK85738.1 hypothetical protein GCM10017653_38080 [Ancylobacter defluvii]
MEWLNALFQNGPAIIRAASETGLGIVALVCLIIGCVGVVYLARTHSTHPWIGFFTFALFLLGSLSLAVVALYTGAKRPLALADARLISFKTPYYNEQTKTMRLLDASVINIGDKVWREFQERPDGNAEYYHLVKTIEPDRMLFMRRPGPNGEEDSTELIIDLSRSIICYRDGPESPTLQCPYALISVQ